MGGMSTRAGHSQLKNALTLNLSPEIYSNYYVAESLMGTSFFTLAPVSYCLPILSQSYIKPH